MLRLLLAQNEPKPAETAAAAAPAAEESFHQTLKTKFIEVASLHDSNPDLFPLNWYGDCN